VLLRRELGLLALNRRSFAYMTESLRSRRFDAIYERYSLLHFGGLLTAKSLGIPHVLEVNAPLCWEEEAMRAGLRMRRLALATERYVIRNSNRVIVVSEVLRRFVVDCGARDDCVTVLPNAYRRARECDSTGGQSEAPRTAETAGTMLVIGFVGSFKPWHGISLLLEVFSAMAADNGRLHLLLIGDGPLRATVEARVSALRLNERVTFTGAIDHAAVQVWLSTMDIAVAPYDPSSFFYFSPIKVFEYMGAGLPVLAASLGQLRTLIRHGETGLLFEAGNATSLQSELTRLVRSPELRSRLGTAARMSVEAHHSWSKNAEVTAEVVLDAIQRR
jgi:glycosyltransferase involved in cell wall biosynthesis